MICSSTFRPAPKGAAGGRTFANAEEASQYLIKEHCISTVPWDDAGAYLRFGATFESAGRADDARASWRGEAASKSRQK